MLLFSPLGGSKVILIPFMRIVGGKISDGMDVNQILKSLWRFSGIFSRMRSNSGINEGAK